MLYPGSWDKNLSWAEFSYNNSYKESLKIAPFEALYRRRCHTPLYWIEPGEKAIFGLTLLKRPKQLSVAFKKTYGQQDRAKRVMQTRGIDLWSSQFEIRCTSSIHP
jgi:hypothetical protein